MSDSSPAAAVGRADRPTVMEIRGLCKRFPGVQALSDVDLSLREGEILGLVGQNGAGKSTLLKIVSGALRPDAGTVLVGGAEPRYGSPRALRDAGVAVIYQELMIVPDMTAADNVLLSGSDRPAALRTCAGARARFEQLARGLDIDVDPFVRAGSLSVARQQQLEIMRALNGERRIILMDEPTAALGHHEREALYKIIATLRRSGIGIVYISHDLDEVLQLCDRVSVLRDGRLIRTQEARGATKRELVAAMVGASAQRTRPPARQPGNEVLRVEGLTVPGRVHDVALSVRTGEVLGLAGLVGAGRTEILRAIAGADRAAHGSMFIDDRQVPWPRSVHAGLRLGIALAPEDRKGQGLILGRTAAENVVMANLRPVTRAGFVSGRRRQRVAAEACRPLAVDTTRLTAPVGTFSGGNQQKIALAKWIHRGPRVLLMDEPTRGIDIGAKGEILDVMRRLADGGLAVIFVSSELEEVVEVADRAVVIAGGRAAAELDHAELSVDRILSIAFETEAAA